MFYGFVPSEQRERLLKFTKQNAPPPDTSKDFQALKVYTAKMFNAVLPGQNLSENKTKFLDTFSIPTALQKEFTDLNIDITCLGLKNCLNERLVAAESCWFAATIMKEIKGKLFKVLPEDHHNDCTRYISELQQVVGQLQTLVYRSICPQLCLSNAVPARISECQWADAKKQPVGPNLWVKILSENCGIIWEFLNKENEYATGATLIHILHRMHALTHVIYNPPNTYHIHAYMSSLQSSQGANVV